MVVISDELPFLEQGTHPESVMRKLGAHTPHRGPMKPIAHWPSTSKLMAPLKDDMALEEALETVAKAVGSTKIPPLQALGIGHR